jgi:hypothetical protein
MKSCKSVKHRKYAITLCMSGILLFLMSGLPSPLFSKDELNVTRDKDKTVYTIDSSETTRQADMQERDRTWDMLRNMPIILDRRQGGPVQPVPAKP